MAEKNQLLAEGLFWISKTAQSTSLSNSGLREKRSIQSHVQHRVRLKRRLQTISLSVSKTSSADPPTEVPSTRSKGDTADVRSYSNGISAKLVDYLNNTEELDQDVVVRLIYRQTTVWILSNLPLQSSTSKPTI
jgi:hypothetical protein